MRYWPGVAALALAISVMPPGAAREPATPEQVAACDDSVSESALEAKVAACTIVIDETALPTRAKAVAYAKRGMLYSELGRHALAAADSDAAIALDASNPMLWLARGFTFVAKGDFAEGRAAFDKGIGARPNDPLVLSKRGTALIALRKPTEALADAEAALAVDPVNFEARIVKAQALASLGDHAKAEPLFDGLIAQSPEPYVYVRRAQAHMTGRQYAKAAADYGELLRSDPENASLYLARGEAYRGMGALADAIADYSRSLTLQPGQKVALNARGAAYGEAGELALAVADYDKALLLDSKDSALWNGRCWVRAAAGADLAKALSDCNIAIELEPANANSYDSRAMVRLKMGDDAGAFADYDKAVTYDAKQASHLYGRGIAAIRLGREAEGKADLVRAAALDSGIAARFVKDGVKQ
jgi:tetratricopeptide (TPR) repeat protein